MARQASGSHQEQRQGLAFTLAYLQFRLIHFTPDVVVIKSSYNDYLPYVIPGMQWDYTHAFPTPYHLDHSRAYWAFARHSYFLKMLGCVMFQDEIANPFRDFAGHVSRDRFESMDYSVNEGRF